MGTNKQNKETNVVVLGEKWLDSFSNFLALCSQVAIESLTHLDGVKVSTVQRNEVSPTQTELEVHYILLASKELNICLKVIHDEAVSKAFLSRFLNRPMDQISSHLASDYTLEICNLCAGVIQRKLKEEFKFWVSLPFFGRVSKRNANGGFSSVSSYGWQVQTSHGNFKFDVDIAANSSERLPVTDFAIAFIQPEEDVILF